MIDSERKMWVINEKKVFKELGYETQDSFLNSLMGQGKEHSVESIYNHYGLDFPMDEFYSRLYEYNRQSVERNEVPFKPGFEELLKFLKTTDIKLTVGTSSSKDYVYQILNNLKVKDEFDHIICGDEVKHSKPDPDIYLKCMSYYNYDPQEVIVFEDADAGGRAALAAKTRLIIIKDLSPISEYVESNAFKVLPSLDKAIDIIKLEI